MSEEHVPEYLREHALRGDLLLFRLRDQLEELRRALGGGQQRRGLPLLKQETVSVVLTVLRAGGDIAEHDTSGIALVQVLDGRVRLRAGSEERELVVGDLASIGPGVPHHIHALEDAAILVTVALTGTR
ncbi:MAG TPA: cupin domain-containing protein [Dehalococcoidia bacterium]|nr:cupin domain-containing protein [Dehalococcoidia bacterium]